MRTKASTTAALAFGALLFVGVNRVLRDMATEYYATGTVAAAGRTASPQIWPAGSTCIYCCRTA